MSAAGTVPVARPAVLKRGESVLILVTSLLFTSAALVWAYRAKAACGGAPFHPDGRSYRFPVGDPHAVIPCYSDLMFLWVGRDVNNHVFPYIHGGITDGHLWGGVVEYPVLSGLFMWLGAIGAHTDLAFFQHSALLLAPFALAITVLLAFMARWWVMLWAATPALVLYAFHNWELPVVFTSVAAIAVMAWGASANPRTGERRSSLRTSAIIASVLLAVGFSLKIYPGLFVLPLALYVLTRGELGDTVKVSTWAQAKKLYDWASAGWVVAAALITTLVAQVPFMVLGYQGWKAALTFQGLRKADVDTNTFWYWGVRFLLGRNEELYNTVVGKLSPLLIVASVVFATWLAWREYRKTGVFPWIASSFTLLAGFMAFHKVHSPQYTLWLLPFFVLLRVPWQAIAAYLVTDVILDLTIFRLFGLMNSGAEMKWWVMGGVNLGVWVHWLLLLYFLIRGVRFAVREPLASYQATRVPPLGPLTRLADADAATAESWLGAPTLTQDGVTVRPLSVTDAEALAAVPGDDPDFAPWSPGVPRTPEDAVPWITAAIHDPHRIPFAVLDTDGRLVGTTSYYDVEQQFRSLAIGFTYYAADAQRTSVNPAAKLALLTHAFDDCGAVRVVWHTHEDNARSRAAVEKLGAGLDGLLPKHRPFGDGHRTTALYSMTDDDWEAAKTALSRRSAPATPSATKKAAPKKKSAPTKAAAKKAAGKTAKATP
ncbi:MAG: GNAT family N-acetyltransferase [Gordonia sp. (in: high G+C Gram-positive bacteria)]